MCFVAQRGNKYLETRHDGTYGAVESIDKADKFCEVEKVRDLIKKAEQSNKNLFRKFKIVEL